MIFRKAHLSSKKLLEQCQKLEKLWTHVYTGTLNLTSITAESQWYTKLSDLIDKQQTAPIWMSESKVITFVIFEIRHLSNLFILIYIKSVNLQKNITVATAFTFRRKNLVFMKFFEHYYRFYRIQGYMLTNQLNHTFLLIFVIASLNIK